MRGMQHSHFQSDGTTQNIPSPHCTAPANQPHKTPPNAAPAPESHSDPLSAATILKKQKTKKEESRLAMQKRRRRKGTTTTYQKQCVVQCVFPLACVNLQDRFTGLQRRQREQQLAIESACKHTRKVNKRGKTANAKLMAANNNTKEDQPGRRNAGSIASGRLVAPITTIAPRSSSPSISANRVDTIDEWIWSCLLLRTGASPSISSKKIMAGCYTQHHRTEQGEHPPKDMALAPTYLHLERRVKQQSQLSFCFAHPL
jgi:hypothetical protein